MYVPYQIAQVIFTKTNLPLSNPKSIKDFHKRRSPFASNMRINLSQNLIPRNQSSQQTLLTQYLQKIPLQRSPSKKTYPHSQSKHLSLPGHPHCQDTVETDS